MIVLHYHKLDTSPHSQAVERRTPALSPDGYIRLPLAGLTTLPFVHLFSETDAHFLEELQSQTVPARSAGFSEWKSDTTPAVSLGWGWFVHSDSDRLMLAPEPVRSNVMLVDTFGYDLGPMKTSDLFSSWLEIFNWQDSVSLALRDPLAC